MSGSVDSGGYSPQIRPSSPTNSQAKSSLAPIKNLARIKGLYVDFVLKIKKSVLADLQRFKHFKADFCQWYPRWSHVMYMPGASHLERVEQIFSVGREYLKWNNFFNCDFLFEVAESIKDPHVLEAKKIFLKDRHAYGFSASIATYVKDNDRKIAQFSDSDDAKVKKQNDRYKKEYRATVTAKLDFSEGDMTKHSLKYLDSLWSELRTSKTSLLPKISTILDCIYYHCLCIRWIILSEDVVDNIKFVVNPKHGEEYAEITAVFRKYRVVRFELDGDCLYSSEEESQLNNPSLSLTEEPHNEQSSNLEAETSTATLTAEDNDEPASRPESPSRLTEPPSDPGDDELTPGEESNAIVSTVGGSKKVHHSTERQSVPQEERGSKIQWVWETLSSINIPFITHVSQRLVNECKRSSADIEKVKYYLRNQNCDIHHRERDEFQWDAFMWACDKDHTKIAMLLLEYKPNMGLEDKKLWTPLVLAARAGDVDVVRGVVELSREQGLGPGYIDKPTNKKWTPLMWAAHRGHAEVVEYLLRQKATVDFPDNNGWTPLMQASQEGNADVVEILLAHGANPNHQVETTWSALMAAAKNKHAKVADILLSKGAEVGLQRNDGSTALQVASYYEGNSEVIEILLKHGAKVDHFTEDGITALMIAAKRGYTDIVKTLMEGGADPNLQHRRTGWTAIVFAAKCGLTEVSDVLLEYEAKIELQGMKANEIAAQNNKGKADLLDKFNKLFNPTSGEHYDDSMGSSVDPPGRPDQGSHWQ